MSGRKSKNKGYRGEKEFADITGGKRVPLSGAVEGYSNDVLLGDYRVEVKRRKDGFKQLYSWLEDDDKPDMLAVRADRKGWLMVVPLDLFLKILSSSK